MKKIFFLIWASPSSHQVILPIIKNFSKFNKIYLFSSSTKKIEFLDERDSKYSKYCMRWFNSLFLYTEKFHIRNTKVKSQGLFLLVKSPLKIASSNSRSCRFIDSQISENHANINCFLMSTIFFKEPEK